MLERGRAKRGSDLSLALRWRTHEPLFSGNGWSNGQLGDGTGEADYSTNCSVVSTPNNVGPGPPAIFSAPLL